MSDLCTKVYMQTERERSENPHSFPGPHREHNLKDFNIDIPRDELLSLRVCLDRENPLAS